MDPIRYDQLARLVTGRQPSCGSTTVIAVDGPSGSGKSELADGLAEAAGGAMVLRFDDVYPGWRGLAQTPPMIARGVLGPIAVGEIGTVNRWDWGAGRPGTAIRVPPVDLLILDGVGSGARALRPFVSVLIWVEAPLDVRKRRALARDGGAYEPFWDIWAAQEAQHFRTEQTRSHADLVIDTTPR